MAEGIDRERLGEVAAFAGRGAHHGDDRGAAGKARGAEGAELDFVAEPVGGLAVSRSRRGDLHHGQDMRHGRQRFGETHAPLGKPEA